MIWNSLFLCLLLAQQAPQTQPATRPVDWFRMSPEEFAQTAAAQQDVPWPEVDDLLMSAAILHQTNRHRAEHKLAPLRHMPKLDEAAVMHAADMSEGGWFSHVNPDDPKKREVIDRVKLLRLNPMFVGENIAGHYAIKYEAGQKYFAGPDGASDRAGGEPIPAHSYQSFAETIVDRWMNSPPHRENILSKHARFLGSACRAGKSEKHNQLREYNCVQVFFTPMSRS